MVDLRSEAEDYRLGRWVRAVVLRWTASGFAPGDRARLFALLLRELVIARTRGTGTDPLVDGSPEVFADELAARRGERAGTRGAAGQPRRGFNPGLPGTGPPRGLRDGRSAGPEAGVVEKPAASAATPTTR